MANLQLASVSKSFGKKNILSDLNLRINDGEFLVLVGPSGCGKSTLLRLIAGLETLSSGEIYLDDRAISHLPPKERNMAMVFQSYALYPHLNVYDNIAFGLRRQELSKSAWFSQHRRSCRKKIDQRIHEVSHLLQIEHLLNRKPKDLSGGQKQRVALGRAIARNPQLFLMDEPLSNLDAQLRNETRSQIVQLQKKLGITTIYVTHDQTEAMTMGDRIAILKDGQLQQIDTPLNLYRHPHNQLVGSFLGTPAMNFLTVSKLDHYLLNPYLQNPIILNESQQKLLANYKTLVIGIRPEHWQIANPEIAHLSAPIHLVEALGSEIILILELGNTPIRIKLSTDHYQPAPTTHWQIDISKAYFFDPTTTIALYP
jgi:multiple sugar transport system ATP-binding protein